MARADCGVFSARAPAGLAPVGSDYAYLSTGAWVPDPIRFPGANPPACTGRRASSAAATFAGPTKAWRGLPLAEPHLLRAARRDILARGDVRRRRREARPTCASSASPPSSSCRWRRSPASALGLRRRLTVRPARGVRRPRRRCARWSTPATPTDSRVSRRRLQPPRPEGNYLPTSARTSPTATARPGAPPLNFDGPDSDEVRRFFVDNALVWLRSTTWTDCASTPFTASRHFGARHILQESRRFSRGGGAPRAYGLAGRRERSHDPRVIQPTAAGGLASTRSGATTFITRARCPPPETGAATSPTSAARPSGQGDRRRLRLRRPAIHVSAAAVTARPRRADPGVRFVAFNQNHDQIAERLRGGGGSLR